METENQDPGKKEEITSITIEELRQRWSKILGGPVTSVKRTNEQENAKEIIFLRNRKKD